MAKKSPQRKKSTLRKVKSSSLSSSRRRGSSCHFRSHAGGEHGNPVNTVSVHAPFHRNATTSVFVILAAAVMMYSFFSVVQAQSILKHEAPQCEGFVACTKLFFNNLWTTLTGNPTPSSTAQVVPGGG